MALGTATYLHPTPAGERVPVVDLRSPWARAGRRVLLGALHLPATEWADRSLEFPPRQSRFALIVSRRDAASVVRAGLVAAHFGEPAELVDADADLGDADAANGELRASERADADAHDGGAAGGGSVADADAAAAALFEAFISRAPPERVGVAGSVAVDAEDARLQPRLWLPSPLLHVVLARREAWLGAESTAAASAGDVAPPLRVLDAGCGTARNAVFVAESAAGVLVVAVDNRRAMVEKARKFAARCGLGAAVKCIVADIDAFIEAAAAARGAENGAGASARAGSEACRDAFDVALFLRFTHKPALSRLAPLLQRCSLVVVEAFHVTAPHPSDRAQQLAEGELAVLLSGAGRTVATLLEELAPAEDGRPLLRVVCRVESVD